MLNRDDMLDLLLYAKREFGNKTLKEIGLMFKIIHGRKLLGLALDKWREPIAIATRQK